MFKRFKADITIPELNLASLPDEVLELAVKDAQAMILAQFESHMGLMSRAFTMSGLFVTSAAALIAASISIGKTFPAYSTVAVSLLLLLSGMVAGSTALPAKYGLPGNEPHCWNLAHWPGEPSLKQARLDQLAIIRAQITKNKASNKRKAIRLLWASAIATSSILLGLFLLVLG